MGRSQSPISEMNLEHDLKFTLKIFSMSTIAYSSHVLKKNFLKNLNYSFHWLNHSVPKI